jgi:2-amino-4-hydroxy-6-hydroxymethyldihydropteridine diphosphokinase
MTETTAYLSLGANLGDARATIAAALARLSVGGARLVARSGDYQTPPWGKLDQPPFVNVCAEIATDLSAMQLLRLCLATETSLGRTRSEKWGPRTIDIDVLTFGAEVLNTPDLKLPHPHMLERAFVLIPLLEIAPDLVVSRRDIGDVAGTLATEGIHRLP